MHPEFFSLAIEVFIWCLAVWLNFFILVLINFPTPAEERSLAIPLIPRQSALLGVIEISIELSNFVLKYLLPKSFSLFFSSIIPAL